MKKSNLKKLQKLVKEVTEQLNPMPNPNPAKDIDRDYMPLEPYQCGPGPYNMIQAQQYGVPMNACFPCGTHSGPGGTYDYGPCANGMSNFIDLGGGTTQIFASHEECIAHPNCVQHFSTTDDAGNVLTVGSDFADGTDYYDTNIGYIDDEGNYQLHRPPKDTRPTGPQSRKMPMKGKMPARKMKMNELKKLIRDVIKEPDTAPGTVTGIQGTAKIAYGWPCHMSWPGGDSGIALGAITVNGNTPQTNTIIHNPSESQTFSNAGWGQYNPIQLNNPVMNGVAKWRIVSVFDIPPNQMGQFTVEDKFPIACSQPINIQTGALEPFDVSYRCDTIEGCKEVLSYNLVTGEPNPDAVFATLAECEASGCKPTDKAEPLKGAGGSPLDPTPQGIAPQSPVDRVKKPMDRKPTRKGNMKNFR